MAKVKIDFNTEDLSALNDADLRDDKINEIHEAVDACIEAINYNLKASITIDTDKE